MRLGIFSLLINLLRIKQIKFLGLFFLLIKFYFYFFQPLSLFGNNNDIFPLNYALEVSKAETAIETGDYITAGIIAKRLMKQFPLRPDAFYIYGKLHLKDELYELALNFFNKAEKLVHPMVLETDNIRLLMEKVKIFQKKKDLKNLTVTLAKITEQAEKQKGIFYEKVTANAYFLLGEINYRNKEWALALDQLLKAIKFNYPHPIIPYLYLSNYFADFSQGEIEATFNEYMPLGYRVIPDKESSFIFYYRLYRSLYKESDLSFLDDELYQRMDRRVQNYFYSISGINGLR